MAAAMKTWWFVCHWRVPDVRPGYEGQWCHYNDRLLSTRAEDSVEASQNIIRDIPHKHPRRSDAVDILSIKRVNGAPELSQDWEGYQWGAGAAVKEAAPHER